MVIRAHQGAFRAAACHSFSTTSDTELSEILACRHGVQLVAELNVTKLELELDSKNVVNMLNDQSKNLSSARPVVEDIKVMLPASFRGSQDQMDEKISEYCYAHFG